VAAARRRIRTVSRYAATLRAELEVQTPNPSRRGYDAASELVSACSDIAQWLHGLPAPAGLERAEAEIGAAAGVLRNAAFAFRSLAQGVSDRFMARCEACQAMLAQGDLHVEAFMAMISDDITGSGVSADPEGPSGGT